MPKRRKIALIGAGNIGGTLALLATRRQLGDVVLFDVQAGLARGKALDLQQMRPLGGFDVEVVGTDSYQVVAGADVVVVTAGRARRPGMSRRDLLATNLAIVREVAIQLRRYCPDSFVIVLTNPLDAMAYVMKSVTGFPREQVVGMAGVLDAARFRSFVAQELRVSVKAVQALVLGGHGDAMVPLVDSCTVGGIPLRQLLDGDRLAALVERTRAAGAEIVGLLGSGSAFYTPAAAALSLVEAFLRDEQRLLPCAAYLQGEYGVHGLYLGVPVIIGARGMERVVELRLQETERAALDRSIEAVRRVTAVARPLLGDGPR